MVPLKTALSSVCPPSALGSLHRATRIWPPPICAATWRERVCHARLQLGNVQITPLWAWDSAGWKCQVEVPLLLWSPLFMCQMQARRQKGTTQYFTAVLKDEGPAVGGKGRGEVGRYLNVRLECVMLYKWDVTGTLRVNYTLSSSSLLQLAEERAETWLLFQPSVTVVPSSWGWSRHGGLLFMGF